MPSVLYVGASAAGRQNRRVHLLAKKTSFFSCFYRWIHRVLLEASDDPRAPADKHSRSKRQLHNAFLIQLLAALTGIMVILLVPLAMFLITTPHFVISYLITCVVISVTWGIAQLKVNQMNERDFQRTARSSSDLATEASSH
jgi:hypothetical protein